MIFYKWGDRMTGYDVIIIGGGVIGGSIAFHLSKKGFKVLLLERDRIASGASSAAAGMLGAQAEMQDGGPLFELARRSRRMFPKLAEELRETCGIDIGLVQKGMLKIAHLPEQVEEYRRNVTFQQSLGEQAEWLTLSQAQEREPALSNHILGAMYFSEEGQVLAPELSRAYVQAAAVLGAEIREYAEVNSLLITNGKVKGVITNEGTIHCDQVIMAAGVCGSQLLKQTGLSLNVYPVKGECFSVVTHTPLIQSTIFSHGCYLVPKQNGRIVVGATMIEHSYDRSVSMEGLFTLMSKAKVLIPSIAAAQWETSWAGLRPQTLDGLPYLGEAPNLKGLFIAMGHYRNGILLSPITGKIMTDLVEGKEPKELDLSAFSPARHQIQQ
jgi:glycine oxidase